MGEKGIADILGIYNGKFLAIEIKTARGRVSPEQQRFLANVNQTPNRFNDGRTTGK